MLAIEQLDAGYGKKQVLFGISLEVRRREIVAVIGPNGAGKSTLLKSVHGLIPAWSGSIHFDGAPVQGSTAARNVSRGMAYCPQGNRVFAALTVKENLQLAGLHTPLHDLNERIAEVLVLFPALRNRVRQYAGTLSGGEQQMLALARALVPKPQLLMLDEPSLGLSPALVSAVFASIVQIAQDSGVAILVVEQKVQEVLNIAQRVYSLKLGRVAFAGQASELEDDTDKLKQLFM